MCQDCKYFADVENFCWCNRGVGFMAGRCDMASRWVSAYDEECESFVGKYKERLIGRVR